MKKNLYIFSLGTPITEGEVFLKNEIDFWLNHKEIQLIVVPTKPNLEKTTKTPDYVDLSLSKMLSKKSIQKIKLLFNPLSFFKCIKAIPNKHIFKLGAYRETLDALAEIRISQKWLDSRNDKTIDNSFYSFWLTNTILGIAEALKNTDQLVISRTHRFDLYDNTQYYKFFPFRKSLIGDLDVLMPASVNAESYLNNMYSENFNKIKEARC